MRTNGNRGFTFIEVLTVLGIIALATAGIMGLRDWASSNARIAEAKSQIATIQSGVYQWRPRNGIYTGISMQELSSVAAIPVSWQSGENLNPWGGNIDVSVDSSDPTRFTVTMSNLRQEEEGLRLSRDLESIATEISYSSQVFEVTFQG